MERPPATKGHYSKISQRHKANTVQKDCSEFNISEQLQGMPAKLISRGGSTFNKDEMNIWLE